jgi:hypothetical protein
MDYSLKSFGLNNDKKMLIHVKILFAIKRGIGKLFKKMRHTGKQDV